MDGGLKFDYYYGIEAEQFSFYRVPRLLIKDVRFKGLSSDAKLLYGLMLDRMALSMKNGWLDEENRAYIIYTVDAVMEDLGCSKPTCTKIMRELDSDNGIGLIEKKRRGLGKPDVIYVKNFGSALEEKSPKESVNADVSTEVKDFNLRKQKNLTSESKKSELQEKKESDFKRERNVTSRSKKSELQEVKESDFKRERNLTSDSKEIVSQEVKDFAPSYNNTNYNNLSYTNPINQSDSGDKMEKEKDVMSDINAYIALIKENIDYEYHMKYDNWQNRALYEELFEVICEVVCVKHTTIRIAGEEYPYELVKSKFLKLNSGHLEYVIDCMRDTNKKIANIKAYLLTALYNAPSTINHYYQQEVQHDMYGGAGMKKALPINHNNASTCHLEHIP